MPGYNQKPVQQKNSNGQFSRQTANQTPRPSGTTQNKTTPPIPKPAPFNHAPSASKPVTQKPVSQAKQQPQNNTRPPAPAQKSAASSRIQTPPPIQQRPVPAVKPQPAAVPAAQNKPGTKTGNPAVKLNVPGNSTPKPSSTKKITPQPQNHTPKPSSSAGVKTNNHASSHMHAKPHNGSQHSTRSSRAYPAQTANSNTKLYLMIGIPAVIIIIVIIIAVTASGGGKKQPPADGQPTTNRAVAQPSGDSSGASDKFRELTADWKNRLDEADQYAIDGDKITEKAEDSDLPVEERLKYFDEAESKYQMAIQIYESFCMEYSGCVQFGYDDKYDKTCKKNKNVKANKINLEERSKHSD